MKLLKQLSVIAGFSIIGEIISYLLKELLDIFIPGSLIGMIILFILLTTKVIKYDFVDENKQYHSAYLRVKDSQGNVLRFIKVGNNITDSNKKVIEQFDDVKLVISEYKPDTFTRGLLYRGIESRKKGK